MGEARQGLVDRRRDAQIAVDDLTRAQKKADADVEQVRGRRKRDQDRIDQGVVTSPKDLEHLQQELVSLARRISDLEDAELEVMEQLESAQGDLEELSRSIDEVEEKIHALEASRAEKAVHLEQEMDEARAKREQTATGLPEDLTALYARLREQKGGIGAAALRARRCEGCSLELNAADLGVIAKAPEDEVLRCEECSRILVRTAESGL